MPELTVPTSPIQSAGRAAQVRVETDQTDAYLANFGQQMERIGDKIQAAEDQHELARAKVDLTRDLGELNLKYRNVADPAEIDRGWAEDMAKLKATYQERISERNWGKVDLAIDDLGNRYAVALGQRAIDLRADRSRATLVDYTEETYRAAAATDNDAAQEEMFTNLADSYADAVSRGEMTEEAAAQELQAFRDNVDRATARRLLTNDPAALIEKLENDGFQSLDPQVRETLRASALSAIASAKTAEEREAERLAKEREKAIGEDLGVVIHNAAKGRTTAFEIELMTSPAAQAHPKYQEALEAVNLRNSMPEFAAMTLAEMDAAIAEEEKRPLERKDETNRLDAMKSAREAAATAWEGDPYAQAAEVFRVPPPELVSFDPAAPQDFVASLQQRRRYAETLQEEGYVSEVRYFSNAELETLKEQSAVQNDPRDRLMLAASLAQAFGEDAAVAFAEIGGDVLFEHAGGMMAAGGNPDTARKILLGQQALDAETVVLPKANAKLDVLFSEFSTLFEGNDAAEARIREVADAIYASEARGLDPTAESTGDKAYQTYARALHLALGGGYDKNGRPVGGVGEVQGGLTILPVGVGADVVEAAFERQLEATIGKRYIGMDGQRPIIEDLEEGGAERNWQAASVTGGLPQYAGEPLEWKDIEDLRLRAVGDDVYQLYVEPRPGYSYDITDSENPGQPFRFSLRKFIRGVTQ